MPLIWVYRRAAVLTLALGVLLSAACQARTAIATSPAGFAISYNVPVVAQSKTMSCWAAAAAMLIQWKTNLPTSEFAAAKAAGPNFVIAFNNNTGILGPEIAELARALNLSVEVPQNYNAQGYRSLLAHGPLWVGTAISSPNRVYRHIRIVAGISGDGTMDGSRLDIIDPDGGRRYQSSVTAFATELQTIAQQDLGAGANLNPQIIHYP